MKSNICPVCGKEVMPYRRYLREAEPFKISPCGSCGAKLRRGPKVFYFVLLIMPILILIALVLFFWLTWTLKTYWVIVTAMVILCASWVVLTNYLAWRLVGWIPAEEEKKS